MSMSIRVALVLTLDDEGPEAAVATIDSIRQQTAVPWFTRIVDNSSDNDALKPEVVEAVKHLRFFCPNVIVISEKDAHTSDAYVAGIKHVRQRSDFDAYLIVAAGTILDRDTVYEMVNPLWNPRIQRIIGIDYSNGNRSKWRRFLDRYVPGLWFGGDNSAGTLMAYRRKNLEDNLESWPHTPFQSDMHRQPTSINKKSSYAKDLDLYY